MSKTEAAEIVQLLLNHLPDSNYYPPDGEDGHSCWDFCWAELFADDQENVIRARKIATNWLKEHQKQKEKE